MRKLILIIISFCFTGGCFSQIKFAVKGGVDITYLTRAYQTGVWQNNSVVTYRSTALVGYYGGFFTEIPLTKNILVRPELVTSSPSFKTPARYDLLGNIYAGERKYVLHYVNLPVHLLYLAQLKFGNVWVGTGPYGGMLVGGNYKTGNLKIKLNRGDEPSDDFKNFDYGVNFCAGLRLKNGLLFDFEQSFGLADVTPAMQNSKNAGWSFCIGYAIKRN